MGNTFVLFDVSHRNLSEASSSWRNRSQTIQTFFPMGNSQLSMHLSTPYLCIGHMQVNTLDHVYGRCILRWHNLTSSYTLSSAEATPVRLVGQSSEGVPGLSSPSIHSPPMTCLRFCLSIASLAGTLLGYDAGLLLTSEEDSEAVLENYWSPVSHSSVGSACV